MAAGGWGRVQMTTIGVGRGTVTPEQLREAVAELVAGIEAFGAAKADAI